MTVIERWPHTNPASGRRILLPHKPQLDLQAVVVRITSVRRLEDSSRIAAFRHEHLDSVVDVGFLCPEKSTRTLTWTDDLLIEITTNSPRRQ